MVSERKLTKEQCADMRRRFECAAFGIQKDTAIALLDDLDTADAEIAALKAQMAGMVTLEQVETAVYGVVCEHGTPVWYDSQDEFVGSIMECVRLVASQSTPTEPAEPAKWSAQYTAQQIWDAIRDHNKYALSIGRTDAPEDLADEVMDLLAVRSRYGTKKE